MSGSERLKEQYAKQESERRSLRAQATAFLAEESAPTWAQISEATTVDRLRAIAVALRLSLDLEMDIDRP